MRAYRLLVLFLSLLTGFLLVGCGSDTMDSANEEPEVLGPNASIIRLPVEDDGSRDTVNVARMAFTETTYGFGTVTAGTIVEHAFEFTNTGTVPLLITDTRSTCGCTVADYPRTPVAPGATERIGVRFDTQNKSGHQRKPIAIIANTYPAETTVYVNGIVNPE